MLLEAGVAGGAKGSGKKPTAIGELVAKRLGDFPNDPVGA